MRRVLFVAVLLMACGSLFAERYTISGTVLVNTEGTLFVHLVDEAQFEVPFTGISEVRAEIDRIVARTGMVPFQFEGLAAGRYGIRVYIDTNGNGELDRGLFGPKEPWGMTWQVEKLFRVPNFPDIAFNVSSDIHGIEIDTR